LELEKTMKRPWIFLLMATVATATLGQTVPEEFQGSWGVDGAATTARIMADEELTAENKDLWVKRFTEGAEAGIELIIARDGLEIPGFAQFTFTEILETSPGHASVAALITDPRSGDSMKVELDLSTQEDGALTMKMDSFGALDDDDFGRIRWARQGAGAPTSASVSSDPVEYLDRLKDCTPGEFNFSNLMGQIKSTIVGQEGDRCRVTTESGGYEVVCDYSDETIALLTSEQKYEDARNGVMQGSSDSEESRRMSQECSVNPGGGG
jgi:hypothetical protein